MVVYVACFGVCFCTVSTSVQCMSINDKPGSVALSVACPLRKQRSRDRSSRTAHSFVEK